MSNWRPFVPFLLVSGVFGCDGSEPVATVPAAVVPVASVAPVASVSAGQAPAASPAPPAEAERPVLEQDLAYGEGARSNLVGYLAMPADAAEPLPGIIVIHDWYGLNETVRAATRRLAGEGYVALAVDLFDGGKPETLQAAQPLMARLVSEPEAARSNLRQAYDYLEKYALAPRIASIGWGIGGGWSLQTALLYPESLDGMVMYYGQVLTDTQRLEPLRVPILGFFGTEDRSIPIREVQNFRATLLDLGKNAEVLIVPRVNQAFATPGSANFNAVAADQAWATTLAFLEQHLKIATPVQR